MRWVVVAIWLSAALAYSADLIQHESISLSGRYVALQRADSSVSITEALSGKQRTIKQRCASRAEFAWTPGDEGLVVTCSGTISEYSIATGRLTHAEGGSVADSLAAVSPDGQYLSYVRDNNLWVSALNRKALLEPLTRNGGKNLLVGAPDPIFAAEFQVDFHYWWSPDSSSIAFIESEFGSDDHYVLPGGTLPMLRLKVIDVASLQIRTVFEASNSWPYLLRVAWRPDSKGLVFYRMNRLQTEAELCLFQDGGLKTVVKEKDAYWINAPQTPLFVKGGRLVISSERSGAQHVYLYDLDGLSIRDLTPAGLEVYRLHAGHDDEHVYVDASAGKHQDRGLYRLSVDGEPFERVTKDAGWHQVQLDERGDAYLDMYSTVDLPPALNWYGPNDAKRTLVAAADGDDLVRSQFFTIKTHDNVELPARLFKPLDFDEQKKYPVILYTFSGPRGHVVSNSWDGWQMEWNRSMVRQGYLVLAVDVRGSGGYGHLFEEYIHYRFGAQETADLREVVSYLRRQSYVNGERLGIWGCGYGAHTVVHAMWQFPGGFKAGFADSPIADWKKYDAYFTERYLGLPAVRFNEYRDSTALQDARRMTGSLMVAADTDDVHVRGDHVRELQLAVDGVKKNAEVAKHFQAVARPRELKELMTAMTSFFRDNL